MPHYLIKEKNQYPILVYEAPVDEKTKELRKQFDVDETTGYPRHYNWRRMAQLGPVYKPEDPFFKFGDYNPEQGISTKLTIVCFSAFVTGLLQVYHTFYSNRPLLSRPQYPIAGFLAGTVILNFMHDKTLERAAKRNYIYIDYMRKHPDRFQPIHRPKLREVLAHAVPVR